MIVAEVKLKLSIGVYSNPVTVSGTIRTQSLLQGKL